MDNWTDREILNDRQTEMKTDR